MASLIKVLGGLLNCPVDEEKQFQLSGGLLLIGRKFATEFQLIAGRHKQQPSTEEIKILKRDLMIAAKKKLDIEASEPTKGGKGWVFIRLTFPTVEQARLF